MFLLIPSRVLRCHGTIFTLLVAENGSILKTSSTFNAALLREKMHE